MNSIKINGVDYDPYFIVGVSEQDNVDFVNKMFRQRAKILHPDRMSLEEKSNPNIVSKRNLNFKILTECYEYIMERKKKVDRQFEFNPNLVSNFDTSGDLNKFNKDFESLRVEHPNDFGYTVKDRITKIEDYENFEIKTKKLFKNFDKDTFNKLFEFNQQNVKTENSDKLVHKTNDGFAGYNYKSNGCSNVNNYNGILINGDMYGQTGVGYNDGNYGDYKQSFSGPLNPESLQPIPEHFESIDQKIQREKENNFNLNRQYEILKGSMNDVLADFSNTSRAEELRKYNEKRAHQLFQEEQQNKSLVEKFSNLYKDPKLITDVLSENQYKTKEDCLIEYEKGLPQSKLN